MGGVLSAGAVAFQASEGRTAEELSKHLFHVSIVGGATLALVHYLSVSGCTERASELLIQSQKVGESRASLVGEADCLNLYCAPEQQGWIVVSLGTGIIGACSCCFRSRVLAVTFFLLFAARGVSVLCAMLIAISDFDSCASLTLRTTYWIPPITGACVIAYGGLALKYSLALGMRGRQRIPMVDLDFPTEQDLLFDSDREHDALRKQP